MSELSKNNPGTDYAHLLAEVKERVRSAQYAALKAVNTELVGLYWDIGRMIAERQEKSGWGRSVVENLSGDLTCGGSFPESPVFLCRTSGTCASFIWNITAMKNSNH